MRSSSNPGRLASGIRLAPAFLIVSGILIASGLAPATNGQQGEPEEVERAVIAPLAAKSLLLDGVAVDGRLVVVGERGHVLVSDDSGESWRQSDVPTRATLTGVFFHDRDHGWAVGHDAVIIRTRDGGESWERVYYAPEDEAPLLDVWFRDADNGYAMGAYGFFLETDDGGSTWSSRYVSEDDDFHLNHVSRSDGGRLYLSAEAGHIYRSDDDGATWISLPSPYEGSFFGTLPLENDSLLLYGLRGHFFRSDDAGETWQALESSTTALLTDAVRLGDGTILVAGLGGTILVSEDAAGYVFSLEARADRQGLTTILPTDDGGMILVGEFGVTKVGR